MKLKRWGNSLGVRIPAAVARSLGLVEDSSVVVKTEGDRIVLEPTRPKKFELEALLAGITKENRHAEMHAGPPVGEEAM